MIPVSLHPLEYISAEVFIPEQVPQVLPDIGLVHHYLLPLPLWGGEGELFQDLFHDGVEPAGSYVLHLLVHPAGPESHLGDALMGKVKLYPLCSQEGVVLFGKGVLWLLKDALQVLRGEWFELYPEGQTSLELRDEVGRLAVVKSPGSDEEDVVGLHWAKAGHDCGPLHNGQEVPLHPLPGDIPAHLYLGAAELVQLVYEDNPVLVGAGQGPVHHLVEVNELVGLFLGEDTSGLFHWDPPPATLAVILLQVLPFPVIFRGPESQLRRAFHIAPYLYLNYLFLQLLGMEELGHILT